MFRREILQCEGKTQAKLNRMESEWIERLSVDLLTFAALSFSIKFFTHFRKCLATATHNFKWV